MWPLGSSREVARTARGLMSNFFKLGIRMEELEVVLTTGNISLSQSTSTALGLKYFRSTPRKILWTPDKVLARMKVLAET